MDDDVKSMEARFRHGETFSNLLGRPKDNGALWEAIYKRSALGPELIERAKTLRGPWNLLVLNEDWCGDSVNIIPHIARLKEASPGIDLRIIGRDANPDIMNSHLSGGSRSIPVVIVFDSNFTERGWWGPRPGPLQSWVLSEGLALEKPERYRHIRTWYARDRGATLVAEIISIIEQAESADAKATG